MLGADFSDLSLLRLPAEVEEIISNLPLHSSDSEELIFQFEQEFSCSSNKPSSREARSSEQFVYWLVWILIFLQIYGRVACTTHTPTHQHTVFTAPTVWVSLALANNARRRQSLTTSSNDCNQLDGSEVNKWSSYMVDHWWWPAVQLPSTPNNTWSSSCSTSYRFR